METRVLLRNPEQQMGYRVEGGDPYERAFERPWGQA